MADDKRKESGSEYKKIAVLFPGIGYTCDKPLLYYAAQIAAEQGYEIVKVNYSGFEAGIKGTVSHFMGPVIPGRRQKIF